MGSWTADRSEWPLAAYSVEGNLSNEQLDALMVESGSDLERHEPFVVIFDAGRMGAVSAQMRSRSTEWQRAHLVELKQYCLGTAYVLPSPLLRFVAMTVLMVTRLPTPVKVVETLEDAKTWGRDQLRGAGIVTAKPPAP